MKGNSYQTSILVVQQPMEVFKAITNFRGWWSEEIEGETDKPGEVFFYHYKDVHMCLIQLVEMIPGQKAVYKEIDNYFDFTKDKKEWVNTNLVFEITKDDGKTKMQFTHDGLVPADECYEICYDAWGSYIRKSLFNLITTGKGEPNPVLTDGYKTLFVQEWKQKKREMS